MFCHCVNSFNHTFAPQAIARSEEVQKTYVQALSDIADGKVCNTTAIFSEEMKETVCIL